MSESMQHVFQLNHKNDQLTGCEFCGQGREAGVHLQLGEDVKYHALPQPERLSSEDQELVAIGIIVDTLHKLDDSDGQIDRVMTYLNGRFG